MLQTLRLGYMIEPPADNEYAVDPVGVEIINPSALSSKIGDHQRDTEFHHLCIRS